MMYTQGIRVKHCIENQQEVFMKKIIVSIIDKNDNDNKNDLVKIIIYIYFSNNLKYLMKNSLYYLIDMFSSLQKLFDYISHVHR